MHYLMKLFSIMAKKHKRNPQFGVLMAKPSVYWVKFVAWFSLVGYVAWQSAIYAIANIAWQPNPDLALRLVPDHPLALSLKADIQFMSSQSPASLVKVEKLAKRSLEQQPLNAVAVRLLGYVADIRGDKKKARRMMLLAQKISRRDFGTQLWLIEDAVARNDTSQALYHYDIAMRTTESSHQVLFPTLIGALGDSEVRKELVPYIRRDPSWLAAFLGYAVNNIEDPADVAELLTGAGQLPNREDYKSYSNSLLALLAAKSEFTAFQQYYLSLSDSKVLSLQSAALNINTVGLRYPVAGWQMVDNPAIGGAFSLPDKAGRHILSVFAGTGERGELMSKYLFLKPGSYKFAAGYSAAEGVPNGEIRWDFLCLFANGTVSVWFNASPIQKGRSISTQNFKIKPDCSTQLLKLQLAGGSGQLGADFFIQSVDIVLQ